MTPADAPFAPDYHRARERFAQALDGFEQRVGRGFSRERHVVDAAADLSIDIAELQAPDPRRLYIVVSGIHGVEGYAGSAIQEALLASSLRAFDLQHCGLLLVHALNPSGMHYHRRVNASNVDLNRNFDRGQGELYASDSGAYAAIADLLQPARSAQPGAGTAMRFLASVARAVQRHGFAPLRQATLGGQYAYAHGLFFGGQQLQPETRIFQACFERACARYPELLLTDLHTGYGARGQVSSLFARVDSPRLQALMAGGVRDPRGHDQAYSARGDLVGWCQHAAKRSAPSKVFNGGVVELGTHGLGIAAQLQDLYCVLRENQARHHGAQSAQLMAAIAHAFTELFNPSEAAWRSHIVAAGVEHIQAMLVAGNFVVR